MSTVSHGADIEALRRWATAAHQGADTLQATTATLDRAVTNLPWSGPDAARFSDQWTNQFAPAMRSVADALGTASTHAQRQAQQQELVSSASDSDREAAQARWARRAGAVLFGLLGLPLGGTLGGGLGSLLGRSAADYLVSVAAKQAQRTVVTEVTDNPIVDVAPTNPGDLLADTDAMYSREGQVRLDLIDQPDGSQVAVLYAPGTQEWTLKRDNPNPMNTYGAVAAASGKDSPLRRLMLGAMDQVPDGVPIIIASHSQSSFQALDLAADPYVLAQHNITAVVTSGAGGGNFDLPEGITHVAARNVFDPVAKIGGAPQHAIEINGSWRSDFHSATRYADLVSQSTDPQLQAWWDSTGIGAGSTVTTRVFEGHVQPRN